MSGPRGVQPSWRGWAWLGQAPAGLFRVLEVGWGQLSGTPGLVRSLEPPHLAPDSLQDPSALWAGLPSGPVGMGARHMAWGCSLLSEPLPHPHPPPPGLAPHHSHPDAQASFSVAFNKLHGLSLWRPISPGSIRKGPGA